MKRQLKNGLLVTLAATGLFLEGCSKVKDYSAMNLEVETNRLVQINNNFLANGSLDLLVVSDIEGAIENARKTTENIDPNIDAIIIAGDLYENENIRRNPLYPSSTDNVKEMVEGVRPYAKTKKPVFIIAGNHEEKPVYLEALKKLQAEFPNVYDVTKRSADLQGLNIVGLGGYHDKRFTPNNGFHINAADYQRCLDDLVELSSQGETTVFVTHSPPKSKGKIDYVLGVGNVGDPNLALIMNKKFDREVINFHGHIHEGGANQEIYNAGPSYNVSSVTSYQNPRGTPNVSKYSSSKK